MDDNDLDVQPLPSFIRAIIQPNYLKNVKDTSITSIEEFHNDSARYFHAFIDTLKVNDTHTPLIAILFEKKITHTHITLFYFFYFVQCYTQDRQHFCMLDVMFEWLKWFSKCYHIQLPIELQTLYITIFEYHW